MGNASSGSPAAGGGMNKMFLLLPLMFMTSKMNWENPSLITNLRLGYFLEQLLLLLALAYMYMQATSSIDKTIIFIKSPPNFSDPTPKWKKTTYTAAEVQGVANLAQQVPFTVTRAFSSLIIFSPFLRLLMLLYF